MSGWRPEDESGREIDGPSFETQSQSGRKLQRMLFGQALVVLLVGGALWYRFGQDAVRYATTGGAPPASVAANATVAPSVSARADVEVPAEVSTVGRRFLQSLASGEIDQARGEIAPQWVSRVDSDNRLRTLAAPLISFKARGFRTQFWQPALSTGESARLVIAFDYDRPDNGENRTRVTLRMIQEAGRWRIVDVDASGWPGDGGSAR